MEGLEKMTVEKLKELADENEIEYTSRVKKGELIKKLQAMVVDTIADSKEDEPEEAQTKIPCELTYLGAGPLSGEYRFKEIAGSIAARSEEEAFEKANEIATKHPDLLVK